MKPVKCQQNATNYLVLLDFTHSVEFFRFENNCSRKVPDKADWNELNDLIVRYPHNRRYQMTDMNNS